MNQATTVGIDLAKTVFHLHGVDAQGHTVLRERLTRTKLPAFLAQLPVCLIGMEACGGAHYWARYAQTHGHQVRLINPQFVKAYLKSNKNDANDAEAVCEAVSRPQMRYVPVNTVEQQDIQSLHRVRSRVVGQRTMLVNQIRGLLQEYGLVLPRLIGTVRRQLPAIMENAENGLTPRVRALLAELYAELRDLDQRVERMGGAIQEVFEQHEVCQRLAAIEGIGPLTATALVAAVGDARVFKNGRQMAAWLGLVPRQASTGGRPQLLGISKRGDRYVRMLLIQGAHAAMLHAARKQDSRRRWILALKARRGPQITAVAVANKNARIAWALMARGEVYRKAV